MSKYTSILAAMLILSMFAGIAASNVPVQVPPSGMKEVRVSSMPAQVFAVSSGQADNFTKLEISPLYGNFRLQPGESKEITVTVKNKDKTAVNVEPDVVIMPGQYVMDTAWITVTPDRAEIAVNGSQKFTIKASVPGDASTGYYSTQIAFTNETMPTPYPEAFPYYIHSFQLSLDVWAIPKIQIMTPYISDQLEAGKEYNYDIRMKNTADKAIGISPKVVSDDMYYYGPYGTMPPALSEDAITITAPQSIPANATATVKIHVTVPADTKGYYNAYIDLGIDDPSIREWEGRVSINFNIWNQPLEPFVKNFSLKETANITIEVSSSYYGYQLPGGQGTITKEPSFETALVGPTGKAVLNATKTEIKGSVSMGGDIPPWEASSKNMYQENGVQYMETYKARGQPGDWKLKVLPKNTQGFEYTITIGG